MYRPKNWKSWYKLNPESDSLEEPGRVFEAGADAILEGQRASALYWGTKGAKVTSDFACGFIMPCAGSIVFIPDE